MSLKCYSYWHLGAIQIDLTPLTLRITEDSAKQLMISLLFTEICMIRLLGVMYDYCVSPAHSEKLLLLMKCCISVGRWSRIGTWDWNTTWWTRSRRGIFLWITTGRVCFLRKETGWGKWGRKRFPHFFRRDMLETETDTSCYLVEICFPVTLW